MKKIIKNLFLLICTVGVLCLIPLFLTHDSPIPVEVPQLDAKEIADQKEAAELADKKAKHAALVRKVYSCQTDADCTIMEKDPCGCYEGPQALVAINQNYIVQFNALNSKTVTKTCSEVRSWEKECSSTAHPVCQAHSCKIAY